MDAVAIFPYPELEKVAVDCPVCHTHNEAVETIDRYGYTVPYVQKCRHCSLGYLAEQLTRDGYDRFYGGGYRALITAMYGVKGVRTKVNHFFKDAAREAFKAAPIRSLLDAGGSSGVIGQSIAGLWGSQLTVLDPAADELPKGDGPATIRGYLEDPIPGSYDLAVCLATMDHLMDPVAALTNLRAVSPRLLLDFIDLQRRRQGGGVAHIKIDHPLYWTEASMKRALELAGWRPFYKGFGRSKSNTYHVTVVACTRG